MASKNSPPAKEKNTTNLNIPPHSIEAEQAVLGSILLNNFYWDDVAENVVKEDFYRFEHRLIFEEMEKLIAQQAPVDLITLEQALKSREVIEQVGGFAYLAELSNNTPSAANVVAYANVVREKAIMRELISVGNKIAQNSYSPKGQDVKHLLDEAEREVFAIAEKRTSGNEGPQNIIAILENTISKIEQLSQAKDHSGVTGVSTGFKDLDKKTAGLQKSDLIIVAARPSMGKTTFAMNLCENAALGSEKPVLVFSLEMPAEQIMMRSLASLSRVDQTKIRTGQGLDDNDWAKISSTMGVLAKKPNLFIDDSSGLMPTELRSRARRVYRENGGLSLIMVDYLQLMRAPAFSDNRTLEIAEISRSLKALAKELEVPVIALSQLNRTLENRQDKRPVNSDLRESGSIEQDADLIMFIYRDEVYNRESEEKGIAEIIIGKQRNGPIGRVKLAFQGQFSRFDNLAEHHYYDDEY
ncbi:replicative DNA helicase [Aggregatibacter actinomycetemcomitans]|uniref:replicative DNA helicase n=1 Tax=Aggregatibacter actinomycetemcomitans TaxID=714 RepID=UPI00022C01DF|nr:replicative DNA helicase [Aggregatibacter actinomycetemcomitans]AEW77283.1 replicative DNA helicase [Aggregatibacter actinomycetemcomitans ANH9381]AMQ91446.1 replicative DNA helicase [Aggregatibacter actinomycetemcomitans]KOE51737.1 DNA helicase [Aggregatibacter actinomycetemcomitans serotype b str. I23C]KOE56402.1 DNA helicase [Aggregatibacter actinomycetemcomitans serotype b str. S23A]MBN6060582.1 replicative DNA helicase [Aggregatibacter actinomycetemcomitans]